MVKPLARRCTMVTMKFTDPSNDDVIKHTIPINQTVCPVVAMLDSGG